MNRIMITMLFLGLILMLAAVPVSQDQARSAAEYELEIEGMRDVRIDRLFEMPGSNGETVAYVFHLEPAGFVIVSTDTDLYPVTGVSFRNPFSEDPNPANPGYHFVRGDMELRLAARSQTASRVILSNNELWEKYLNRDASLLQNRDRTIYPPPGTTNTGGWVDTQWNQSAPYNMYCPLDPQYGGRSVTGCVATTLAQILHYHHFIGDASFDNSDDYVSSLTSPSIIIDNDHASLDFPSFPELNVMLDELRDAYNTNEYLTNSMKGALNFAAGVSVSMHYSNAGSGSSTTALRIALLNKFDYDSAEYYNGNNPQLYNHMSQDMIAARPVALGIEGTTVEYGHEIVADGWNDGNNRFHLNMGWGGNSDGWYNLPQGMPAGFNIVDDAVLNIEGGPVPVDYTGYVIMPDGSSPEGTLITMEGVIEYEAVCGADGTFTIPAMWEGDYHVTAYLNDDEGFYYYEDDVPVNEVDCFIYFEMVHFETLGGVVTASGTFGSGSIGLYQDNILMAEGTFTADGVVSIPAVLPGVYHAIASSGNWIGESDVSISMDQMEVNVTMDSYPGDLRMGWASYADGIYQLNASSISMGVRYLSEDLTAFAGDYICGVRFKSPIDESDGTIAVQVWKGDNLISERGLTGYEEGEWIDAPMGIYVPVDPASDFTIGYHIGTTTGQLAWHDEGPRVSGRGAWYHTTTWHELPAADNDFNLCIEPVFATQVYGTITGTVLMDGGFGDLREAVISAGQPVSVVHPVRDDTFNAHWTMKIKPGTMYDAGIALKHYTTDTIEGIEVTSGQTVDAGQFVITWTNTGADDTDDAPFATNRLYGNYPNPFNPVTTIRFELAEPGIARVDIYDIRGRRVRRMHVDAKETGIQQIVWHGRDDHGVELSSGVYLYRIQSDTWSDTGRMVYMK